MSSINNNSGISLPLEANSPPKSSRIKNKIKAVVNLIIGYIVEFFSFLAMSVLYFVSQTRFDPKEGDIARDSDGIADQAPIILVHGYLHNSSGWLYHRRKLNKAGFKNVFTVDLGAIPNKSVAEYAKVLEKRIVEINKITGRNDIKLIGHSMGGLVSSHYALNMAEQKDIEVTDVITLNSPLQGTRLHHFGIGPCVRDMAFDSEFTNNLSAQINNSEKTKFCHVASKADLVVRPYHSALNVKKMADIKTDSSTKIHIAPNLGHTAVLFSKTIVDMEIEYLKG